MIVFNTDLDNTMIYSYKHDIGENKKCVEIYQDREISFITEETHRLIGEVQKKVLFVPTTTRTVEQYNRIFLLEDVPAYALACNGGILLKDGKEDESWYRTSRELIRESDQELQKAEKLMEADPNRTFEVRNIRDLFLFTKCEEPEQSVKRLEEVLDTNLVDVFNNGVKVYVVPKKLSKGMAVKRFREYIKADQVIAAGDSEFDISMLREADIAIAPHELEQCAQLPPKTIIMKKDRIFAESILEYILENIHG